MNIILVISAILVVLLPFASEIPSGSRISFFNKLWFKLTASIIIAIIAFWANHEKENNSNIELNKSSQRLNDTIRYYTSAVNKISLMQSERISDTIKKTSHDDVHSFVEALAKYGLHYDSAQNNIVKLVDSANNEIPDLNIDAPDNKTSFQINKTRDSISGNVIFYNNGNCPINILIKIYTVAEVDTLLYLIEGRQVLKSKLSSNVEVNQPCYYSVALNKIDRIYLFIKENYSTLDSRKKRELDEICFWDFANNKLGQLTVSKNNRIKKFLSDNNIK